MSTIQIVLVDPRFAANIGSVCRAMKTMGIKDLAIVSDKEYDANRVYSLAIHAKDVYDSSTRFHRLEAALEESVLTFGASRRRGKFRKYFSISPKEMAEKISLIKEGRISIVFGRESDGLTDYELALCNMAVRIPTSDEFPSLNLAQAVQILTYTLFTEKKPLRVYSPVTGESMNILIDTITDSLDTIGFFKLEEKEEVGIFFKDILSRSLLSTSESKRLNKMFKKIAAIKVHKPV